MSMSEYSYRTWSIPKGPNRNHVETHYAWVALSKADLDQPSCPACYRPGREQGYCAKCIEKGADVRHLYNRRREAQQAMRRAREEAS